MTGRAGVPASRASSSNAVEMASRTLTCVRSQCAASKPGGTCICERGERGSQVGDHRTRTALAHRPHTRVYPCGRARIPESRAVHAKHTSAYHRHDSPDPPTGAAHAMQRTGQVQGSCGKVLGPRRRGQLTVDASRAADGSDGRSNKFTFALDRGWRWIRRG